MARSKQRGPCQCLTIRLDMPIYEKLVNYCTDAGQSKTIAVQRAIDAYIDHYYEVARSPNQVFQGVSAR